MGTFAVCIPTYNRAAILRATLLDLAQHSDLIDEIVISDNASPDDTRAVVEECRHLFRSVVYFRQDENLGAWRNIHTALSITRCTYQYLLSDDDRLAIQGIQAGLAALRADGEAVAVYGGYCDLGEDGKIRQQFVIDSGSVRFTQEQRLEIFQKYYFLWFPICVSETYQRHCHYDGQSMGFWVLLDQLINAGPIWVMPEVFYHHHATEGRLELDLAAPWYQEFHRADLELFLGRLKPHASQLPQIAEFVTRRQLRLQGFAADTAKIQGNAAAERFYLLRQRGYGSRSIEREREWEEQAIIGCALERLIERVRVSGCDRVILEQGITNLGALSGAIAAAAPNVDIVMLEPEEFVAAGGSARDMFVAQDWQSFETQMAAGSAANRSSRLAFSDLLQMFKLSDDVEERLLFGPAGTPHLVIL